MALRPAHDVLRAVPVLLIVAGLLAGCGGSGSSAPSPGPTSSAPGTPAVTDLPTLPTQSYPNVRAADARHLEVTVVRLPGVQNVTYYPDTKTLQVYFKAGVSAHNRRAARRIVNSYLNALRH